MGLAIQQPKSPEPALKSQEAFLVCDMPPYLWFLTVLMEMESALAISPLV
jgi:hypothetical protein